VIENREAAKNARPISAFISRSDFPACVVGKTVYTLKNTGERLVYTVSAVEAGGTKLVAVNCQTGAQMKLLVSVLRKNGVTKSYEAPEPRLPEPNTLPRCV
jgi:hypothetical protein